MLLPSLEQLVLLLLVSLLIWVLKRLRTSGNGPGLPSLYKRVSLLSKDFGTLVEIIDDLFPVLDLSSPEDAENGSTKNGYQTPSVREGGVRPGGPAPGPPLKNHQTSLRDRVGDPDDDGGVEEVE